MLTPTYTLIRCHVIFYQVDDDDDDDDVDDVDVDVYAYNPALPEL